MEIINILKIKTYLTGTYLTSPSKILFFSTYIFFLKYTFSICQNLVVPDCITVFIPSKDNISNISEEAPLEAPDLSHKKLTLFLGYFK